MSAHTDTRQHVLDTSRDVILGKGFAAVGLTELLTAANVPKGSFYHYFKSKEDFGVALLEDYFDKYISYLDDALAPDGHPGADRFMRFWSQWTNPDARCANGAGCLVVKLGAEVSDLSEPMRTVLRDGTERVVARLARCLVEGIEDGSFPPHLKPVQTALALYELWLGATLMTRLRHDSFAYENALLTSRQFLHLD